MKKRLLPLLALVLALALPARAANTLPVSLDAPFAHGVKLTVSGYTNANGTVRSTPLQDFPVLVRISETAIPGFDYDDLQSKSTGTDIAFIDMSGASLPFDIDEWHPDGTSLVWVKLPVLTNGTEFVMCYGSAASGKLVNADNPFAGYVGVWHMSEASGTVADASGNGLGAVPNGTTANSIAVDGKVGKARQNAVSGEQGNLTVPSYSSVYNGTAFTVSGWFYQVDYNPNDSRLFSRKQYYDKTGGWETFAKSENDTSTKPPTPKRGGKFGVRGKNKDNRASRSNIDLKSMGWTHLTFAYNGSNPIEVYTNGVAVETTGSNSAPTDNTQPLGIGNYNYNNKAIGDASFFGYIDECRLLKSTASGDWAWAEYAGMSDSAFLTAGTVQEYDPNEDPFANLAVASVQYTNATATVKVTALGGNATEAYVTVEFSSDDSFASASIVKTETRTVSTVGLQTVSATGLSYGTNYYVRALLSNDDNGSLALGPVSFTTLTPGSPVGTASLASPGFTSLHATAVASDFGTGAETATMRLEASTSSDFATFVPGTEVDAILNAATALSVSGLSPDTSYYLRVRIRNGYGIDTFVTLSPTSTRTEPFAATGLAFAEGAGGTLDFTFPVTGVYDGATVDAVLTYDNAEIGTRTCTAAETLSWTGVAAASGTATATVVATATLPNDGGTFTKTWTVSVVPGATVTVVTDVSAYASAAGALWVRPGDVVILPELTGNASYQVLNERFVKIDGNTLTALEPGIVGIRCVDVTAATKVMGVVVLPDAIGSGSVYVFDETKHVNSENYADWSNPACWRKVGSATNDSFPQNADDIAILPFYGKKDTQYVRHRADISIGGLYVGMIRPDLNLVCVLERYKDDPTRTVTFRRTDGGSVRVQICSNGESSKYSRLRFGDSAVIDVVWASDAEIDCSSSETDSTLCRGYFEVKETTPASTNTFQNAKLTISGLSGEAISSKGCTVLLPGVWKGTGEIVKKGLGGIAFNGDFSGFSGVIREMSGPNLGELKAPAAGVLMRAVGASNITAHVYGWGSSTPSTGAMSYNGMSRGTLGTGGYDGGTAGQAPGKGLHMHGGTYRANTIEKATWGVGVSDDKVVDLLSVGGGLNYITLVAAKDNGSGYPINAFTAKMLEQTDKGTLVVYDPSCNSSPATTVTNSMFTLRDWADHVVGASGDNQSADVYPIVPWIVVNRDSNFNALNFASFDATGRIVQPKWVNTEIDTIEDERSNVYMSDKALNRNADTKPNITVQSLFLQNTNKAKSLGASRTLTITSGGLVLQGASTAIGLSTTMGVNGSLVLGDATHPAYVWAKSRQGAANEIWAETTAAGGFVKSWPGNLILGGPQTNIAVEIAVNGGSLQLGNESKDCVLADGLPVRVCAGATLKLPYAGTVETCPIQLDGSAEAFGKVELPVNQVCASLSVRDVFESDAWTVLPDGTYGATGSGAEYERDDLFTGPGVLTVGMPADVTFTVPMPLPAHVSLVSVTTNDVEITGEGGVFAVRPWTEVVVTFEADAGYRLIGDAEVSVTVNADTTLTGIPTAEAIPVYELTIPELPANVSLVSVTTNGIAVSPVESVYTVYSNATVVATFAPATGYRLLGDATVTVVMDGDKPLTGIPTAELIPPLVTLEIPLPENVRLVSVTTNGVAVEAVGGVYTVYSNATVTVEFAAEEGCRLVGDATVDIVMDGNKPLDADDMPTAEALPVPTVSQSKTKVYARQTVTLTAFAEGATSYYWLKNGAQIEGGADGTLTVDWRSPKNHPTDAYRAVAVYDIDGLPVESKASAEMTVTNLPMGTVISVGGALSPPAKHDYSADYLTFRVLTSGTISWKSFGSQTNIIEYSIDNGEWTSLTATSEGATISVVEGDLVRFRGSNEVYATSKDAYSGFEGGTATYDIEGNIMSLLHGDDFAESTTLPNYEYIFCSLFKKAPVISAEHLVLPATTLKNYCYRALFSWCESLTKAPALPATTLAKGCYWYMFEQCAITEAPVLNATTLVAECYGHMFEGCGLLNKITCLATNGFNTTNCRADWVKNVAGDGAFVKAANATAWTTGASGIPSGWIVCEDVLLLPPEVSFYGDMIELGCPTEGAEIHYRLGQTGDFALYTQPISIVADTVIEAYSTYQGHTSETVTQTCAYVHETPFEQSNKTLTTWRYGGNTITTPYSVNAIDGHSSSYSKGTFTFETSVTLKEAQPTYLWFQHADQSADIYVDNVNVGTHWGGYNAFFFDISEYVHRGRNDIRVVLRNNRGNALAPAAGDFNFNATLGNVKLFTSPVLPAMEYGYDGFHVTSTVSASPAATNATIYVETKVPTGADLKCIISDGSYAWTNTLASTGIKQTFTNTIYNAHLWNGTLDPHLYTVTLEIRKDGDLYHKYERPYGFRYYSYVINETVNGQSYTGFLLNGQPYQLRGVCMHDDVEGKANALTDADYDQEFAILQDLGCNFVRLAHYPHPKEVYDRCDQLGIIVQTEVPCVNKLQSTMPSDYYTHLETQYIEMVQQHFNHPCIMFWGLSNETTTDDKAFGKEKIEGYYDLIKSMDTERMVGYVMSHSYSDPSGYYNNPDVDWFGCNIYVGWYITPESNDPTSELNKRIKSTITDRSKPLAFSEYGCGGTPHCHSDSYNANGRPTTTTTGNNPRHDIEYQMWLHEGHIAAIRNYPQLLFTSQWQLFDIAVSSRREGYTECLDGENATTNDDLKYLNNKGLVERDHRTKKDTFYLYKAEWNSKDKFVHICGKDYTKTTDRKLKCYTNDGNTLSMFVGNDPTPLKTATVTDHIAEFEAMDFPTGVEIRVVGDTPTAYDTVTF